MKKASDVRRLGERPLRTALLLQDLKFGGTQRQTLELAQHFDRSRFEVEIWTMMEGEDLAPVAEGFGLPRLKLGSRPFVGPDALFNLYRTLKSGRPDIIVLLTVVPNIWGRLLGRFAGTPVIIGTCRGGGSPYRQHEWLLWPFADHNICNTFDLEKVLTTRYGVPRSKVSVIPNGVDTDFFRPPPETGALRRPAVISVARFVPDKNHETLIEAFALTASERPDAELRLVGDGPRVEPMKRLARVRGISDRVRFIPGRPDFRSLLSESSLFALSSIREGLPNVALEAMAAGLPVVATRVGGLPEVVEHGRTGLLVPPRDPVAMAAAIGVLLSDEKTRTAFGEAGRKRAVECHSVSTSVRRHEELFECLFGRARG